MKNTMVVLVAAMAMALSGCGGGGGGSASRADAGFFATDNLWAGYSGVWVTVNRVQLRQSDNTMVTIFEDSGGKVVNLRALNDGAHRFAFFGEKGVPQGTYAGLSVDLQREVTLFPVGSNNGQARVFDDVYGATSAHLSMNFDVPKVVGPEGVNFICDFDLAAWEDVDGEIRNAIIDDAPGNGFENQSQHDEDGFTGVVTQLSGAAPNFTFVLNSRANNKIEVETNSETVVFNNDGQPNPILANGRHVEVRGKFDPNTGKLLAISIKIRRSGDDDEFEVKGPPSQASAETRTFVITASECDGFVPRGTLVKVVVSDETRFFGEDGLVLTEGQFFASLPIDTNLEVEAEGSVFDPNTNTLTATRCKIELEGESEHHEVEARGAPSNLNAELGIFDIALTNWEGFCGSASQIIHITTTGETEYKDGNNEHVSKAEFFVLLALATTVKVEGDYDNGTIVAHELTLRVNAGGGGGHDPQEITGLATNINLGSRSFTVLLIEWDGFNGTIGEPIDVVMNANASYRDQEGNALTEVQFFGMVGLGWFAKVDGTVSGSTMVGTRAKLDDH